MNGSSVCVHLCVCAFSFYDVIAINSISALNYTCFALGIAMVPYGFIVNSGI